MNLYTYLGSDSRWLHGWLKLAAIRRGCTLLIGAYTWDLTKDYRLIRLSRKQAKAVPELARRFDELFKILVPASMGDKELLDFSRLRLQTFRDSGLSFEMSRWPEAEAETAAYFADYEAFADDTTFDIGADCGVSTYTLAKAIKKVIAVEADPATRDILARNVTRLNLSNVTVAAQPAVRFGALATQFGEPMFCRINLDRTNPNFILEDAEGLSSVRTQFAIRGHSWRVRRRITKLMRQVGYECVTDRSLRIVWARPPGI